MADVLNSRRTVTFEIDGRTFAKLHAAITIRRKKGGATTMAAYVRAALEAALARDVGVLPATTMRVLLDHATASRNQKKPRTQRSTLPPVTF